jgi:endonuclease YncB( thermonuclease family)
MSAAIQMHDIVALLDDVPAKHFETGQALQLRRGQIGTVVMIYDGTTFEVEFAGRDGRPDVLLPVGAGKLIVLHESPVVAAA